MDLKNKVIVIVGASQGLGEQLAKDFIHEGAHVIIASKTKSRIEDTADQIGVTPFVVDARNEVDLRKLAEHAVEKFGSIDIWVNSAGVFRVFPKNEPLDMDRAHELFDINFFGTVLGCRTALFYMKDRGGIIINLLSSAALDATRAKNAKLYAASKWAVRGYTDALRGENKDSRVKILSVYPGGTKTHLHDEAIPADFENFMEPKFVTGKIIDNLKREDPEQDLIIKRPSVG